VSKRYVTTIKLKYVQVSGKCGANRERDYAESSGVQGAINGPKARMPGAGRTIMDAAIRRNATRFTR